MTRIPRKSDGRRIFTAEFKREQIGRILRGELTLADLSRSLGIAPSLLHRWKRHASHESAPLNGSRRFAMPVGTLRTDRYIRELQLLVGKQTVELELLRAEMDALRQGRRIRGLSRR
jgi:transposase-like protein